MGSVIRMSVDRTNPTFTISTFKTYIPAMTKFVETDEGRGIFDEYKVIVNGKVFYSVWGDEWKHAFSLLLAHYLVLWAKRAATAAQDSSLQGIASLGNQDGLLTSWSVGEVSKSYSFDGIMINEGVDSAFYNLTSYGREYYALYRQLQTLSIGLVLPG